MNYFLQNAFIAILIYILTIKLIKFWHYVKLHNANYYNINKEFYNMDDNNKGMHANLLSITSNIVSSYLRNNQLNSIQIGKVINMVYKTLHNISNKRRILRSNRKAAVPVKKSITGDYIVCLEDGKKLKMLKRHLRTTYGLSPEEYRVRLINGVCLMIIQWLHQIMRRNDHYLPKKMA